MKSTRSSLMSDLAFILLFIACFVCIVFTTSNQSFYLQNIIFLNIAFLIAIITYFTTVTTGLVLNIMFIFGSGTYTLYETLLKGNAVTSQNYFWLIMTPILTLIIWVLTNANRMLQDENERLAVRNESLATVDENTMLKNSLSFQKDTQIFTALSKRYQIPMTLLVINIRYWNEIKRMISQEELNSVIYDLSSISLSSIRANDSLYMLDQENPTWGLLLFADREGANIVIERLKHNVNDLNSTGHEGKYKAAIHFKIGAMEYESETITTPLEWIVQAKKQIEYDV